MKLQFDKVEEIGFGDLQVRPNVTPELRLRLEEIKFDTEADLQEAKEVLSSVFGEHKDEVRAFMDVNMVKFSLQQLQAYLIGGPALVEKMDQQMTNLMLEQRRTQRS